MPAKIRRFLRPRAALFAAAVFCLPALFSAQNALAQPTSVKLEQNHRDSGGFSLIEVRWAAPASGTVTAYKVRWAQGAGSTAWVNTGGASGVSVAAGTLSYTITEPEDEDFPGNLADGRYDVQVGAEVSGATAWSASAGIVVGSSSLTSLTLGLYVGSELFRSQVIDITRTVHSLRTVSSFVDGIAATATTLGGGDFRFGPVANRRRAASGASTEVIPLAPVNSFQAIEAETGDGQLGPLINILVSRLNPQTAAAAPPAPTVTLDGLDAALRVNYLSQAPHNAQGWRATWRTADPDGAGAQTAGAWQNDAGDDADCAAAPANDPGTSVACGKYIDLGNSGNFTIAELDNTLTYDVRVRGLNTFGAGAWSAVQSRSPLSVTAPATPTSPTAAAAVRAINFSWTAPAEDSDRPVASYRVRWRVSGTGTPGPWQDASGDDAECNDNDADNEAMCGVEVASSATSYAITGLDKVSYDVAVAAVNSAGASAWSGDTAAQATPLASTDATLLALAISPGSLTPSFDAATFSYDALLANSETGTEITAVLNDANAQFTLQEDSETPAAGVSGTASSEFSIDAGGEKTFRIAVTADDGSAQETYVIVVRRVGVPGAPVNPTTVAGRREITVNWQPPASDGFAAVSGYRVRWRISDDGSGSPGPWQDASGDDAECNDGDTATDNDCGEAIAVSARSYTISGLEKSAYDVAAAAVNSAGAGAWSAAQVTPLPNIDATLSALEMSSGDLSPAFDADTADYTSVTPNASAEVGITATLNDEHASFTLQVDSGTPAAGTSGTASTPTALDVGASITFTIVVTADDGSAQKTYRVVATRQILPNRPANIVVIRGKSAFSLDWNVPAAVAGAPITEYRVRWSALGGSTWDGTGGSSGVATGSADATWNSPSVQQGNTYRFAVASVSEAGQSAWVESDGFSAAPPVNPDPPRGFSAASAGGVLQVRWRAPNDADVQSYRTRWKPDGVSTYTASARVATTMVSIPNLTPGKYDVQVAALEIAVGGTFNAATTAGSVWAGASFDFVGEDSADLQSLTANENLPGFSFDKDTLAYEITVDRTTASVALRPTTANSGANIRVTAGTAAPAALASGAEVSVNLQKGIPLTVRFAVTSADGSATKTYSMTLTRTPERLDIPQLEEFRFYGGIPATTVLPEAIGGFPPYSYALFLPGGRALPDELSFDPNTRTLTGDVAAALLGASLRRWNPVYFALDSSKSRTDVRQSLAVTIARPVTFATAAPVALTFEYNTARDVVLPAANGGFPSVSYALSGDALPPGLAFTKSSRTLGGTPTQGGLYRITYAAQDDIATGAGVARADIDLTVTAGPASALSDLAVTPADQRLVLRWTAPADADLGGGVLRDYRVRWAEGSGSTSWVDANGVSTGGTDAFYTIPGLTNGTAYSVQVAAVNSAGTGAWSTSAEGTPQEVLAFATPQADLIFLADTQLASPVVLPAAEHGSTPYTYEVSGLPSGLAFDEGTREISGTPAAGTDAQI
ncbi:MAG: fibronectin type III domain-containing protein, partial [Gammaproteobacteria bacterium]|nr:fibronectin type III domain-containing protein [Gammaproteobacteria bacterium]